MKSQITISKQRWEREFSQGKWNYLDDSPLERARHAIIGMYCQLLKPMGAVLDVGCGTGTLFNFLNIHQRKRYLGIDISCTAAEGAKKKSEARFIACEAEEFVSRKKYDIIVLSEMLYYVDEDVIFEKYSHYLSQHGILIVSLYRTRNLHYDKRIWKNVKKYFQIIDSLEITGTSKRMRVTWKIAVMKKSIKSAGHRK